MQLRTALAWIAGIATLVSVLWIQHLISRPLGLPKGIDVSVGGQSYSTIYGIGVAFLAVYLGLMVGVLVHGRKLASEDVDPKTLLENAKSKERSLAFACSYFFWIILAIAFGALHWKVFGYRGFAAPTFWSDVSAWIFWITSIFLPIVLANYLPYLHFWPDLRNRLLWWVFSDAELAALKAREAKWFC